MLKAEQSDQTPHQANTQVRSDNMSLKASICNFLVNMGNALLRWFGEYSTSPKEQNINVKIDNQVNWRDQPYTKMSDSVKKFLTCDMSENDRIDALAQIALYEAAKVDPYRITVNDGKEGYKIHNGQIVESWKGD